MDQFWTTVGVFFDHSEDPVFHQRPLVQSLSFVMFSMSKRNYRREETMAKLIRSRGVPRGFFAPETARSATDIFMNLFFLMCPISFLSVMFGSPP